jgi:hypothetical protein
VNRARAGATLLILAASACAAPLLACGGSTESEHTATIVRGTYGDPNPIVPCGDPGDGAAEASAPDASDADRDGC